MDNEFLKVKDQYNAMRNKEKMKIVEALKNAGFKAGGDSGDSWIYFARKYKKKI